MADGVWSGGTYACWGTENKEVPLRVCNPTSPSSRNFELKPLDGIANPYIALAGVLGAGLAGIKEHRSLDVKDLSGDKSAAQLNPEERKTMNITQRLPLNWEAGREALANDDSLRKILGRAFIDKYLAVNKV
ncbi:hypothetical protein HGRIS_000455 [Hohenbuehelia grisea]|uniref:GS catalytic domain-containing protein n=1 Tax=Hohenbuehelia grisea TaxID=104357 RepID=A0ABR3JR41_9AGAR